MFSSLFSSFSNPVYCEASTKASEDLPEPAAQSDESSKGLGEKGAEEAEAEEAPAAVEEEDEEEPEDVSSRLSLLSAGAELERVGGWKWRFERWRTGSGSRDCAGMLG